MTKHKGPHTHKCGFPDFKPGCGAEWSHDNADVYCLGEDGALEAHTCKACGRGPWTLQYNPAMVEAIEQIKASPDGMRWLRREHPDFFVDTKTIRELEARRDGKK